MCVQREHTSRAASRWYGAAARTELAAARTELPQPLSGGATVEWKNASCSAALGKWTRVVTNVVMLQGCVCVCELRNVMVMVTV